MLGQVLSVVAGLDDRNPPLGPLELLARRLQQPDPLKGLTLHGCLVSREGELILVRKEGPRRATRRAAEALTPG